MSKKKLIFLGLDVLVLIVTIGVSLAVFSYAKEGEKTNKVTIGAITMNYQEGDDTISLPNATPLSDEEGKVLNNEGEYFDFTLSTTMSMTESVSYEITALKDEEESTLPDEYVRLFLERTKVLQIRLLNLILSRFRIYQPVLRMLSKVVM